VWLPYCHARSTLAGRQTAGIDRWNLARAAHGYRSIVPTDEDRKRLDDWVAVAPDNRLVETTQDGNRWTTQALEDDEVRYEETDFDTDEPELRLLAVWCARQVTKFEPRPPVKAGLAAVDALGRKQG